MPIKAIVGLGNPGNHYAKTRHNIGFAVADFIAQNEGASWLFKGTYDIATVTLKGKKILLLKPQTFMNNSGDVVPALSKQGIAPEETIIIHDELELPFGKIVYRLGGSARGHNGLRSLIARWGENFGRLRIGIARPAEKSDVGTYVLAPFKESQEIMQQLYQECQEKILEILAKDAS